MSSFFDRITDAITNPAALQKSQVPNLVSQAKQCVESDPQAAIRLLTMAAKADPDNVEVWTTLGEAYSDANQSEDAVGAFEKVIALTPSSPVGYIGAGTEFLTLERYPEAELRLMHGLLLEEDQDSVDLYNLALTLFHQEKDGQAIPFCELVLKKGPDTDTEQLLADCFYDTDRFEEAIRHYERALLADPANTHCSANLGYALEQLERPQEAIKALESSLEHGAADAEVYGSLSRCYEAIGDEQNAEKMANKYYEMNPPKETQGATEPND